MIRLSLVATALLLAMACETENPCDRYVDYLCTCHEDDSGVDCAELNTTYAEADPDVQNECALELDEQEQRDQDNGVECPV